MGKWIPPTFNMPLSHKRKLWRQYGRPIPTPYVVMITGGVVTPYPGLVTVSTRTKFGNADSGSGEGGRAVWYGGRVYDITTAEATLLDAAGYDLYAGVYTDTYHDIYA